MVDHSDLINSLMTFFTLLYDLTWTNDKTELLFPDPETGILPEYSAVPRATLQTSVNATIAAGLSPAFVDLIPRLPQLRDSNHDGAWCLSSTYMIRYEYSFENDDMNQGACWSVDQEIYERPDSVGEDKILPGNMMRLTYTNIYGYVLLYDVDTGLLRAWQPFDGPDSWKDEPALPPSEVFAPWIERYRNLTWLVEGESMIDWSTEDPRAEPPKRYESRYHEMSWKQTIRIWKTKCKLRNIYLECGWDLDAMGLQTEFRRDEFLRRREEFWKVEMEPLEELEERLTKKMYTMHGSGWESDEEHMQITEAEEEALLADDLEKSEDEFDEADGEWESGSGDDIGDGDVEYSSFDSCDDEFEELEEGEVDALETERLEMRPEDCVRRGSSTGSP